MQSVQNVKTAICDNFKTLRDRMSVNRKSHAVFGLVTTSVTLNDLERRNSPYVRRIR